MSAFITFSISYQASSFIEYSLAVVRFIGEIFFCARVERCMDPVGKLKKMLKGQVPFVNYVTLNGLMEICGT